MKTTSKIKALEITAPKITCYTALIGLFSSIITFLINILDKSSSNTWMITTVVVILVLLAVIYEGIKIIFKKQDKIDRLEQELGIKRQFEKIEKKHK